jgi:hypothetical protein
MEETVELLTSSAKKGHVGAVKALLLMLAPSNKHRRTHTD